MRAFRFCWVKARQARAQLSGHLTRALDILSMVTSHLAGGFCHAGNIINAVGKGIASTALFLRAAGDAVHQLHGTGRVGRWYPAPPRPDRPVPRRDPPARAPLAYAGRRAGCHAQSAGWWRQFPGRSGSALGQLAPSSATTAKPRPDSPARAASMAAFKASRLVWSAMS